MRKTIESINFSELAKRASNVRALSTSSHNASVSCQIDSSKFTVGWYNIIFEVGFDDGVYWIARVRREPESEEGTRKRVGASKELVSEAYTMAHVKANSNIPIRAVLDFCAEKNPAIGCRYVLMEAIEGRVATKRLRDFIPDEHRSKTYAQLPDIKIQLSQLRFPKIGRLTGTDLGGEMKVTIEPFQAPRCLRTRSSSPYDSALEYYYDI